MDMKVMDFFGCPSSRERIETILDLQSNDLGHPVLSVLGISPVMVVVKRVSGSQAVLHT
jgi:hypothetical protein